MSESAEMQAARERLEASAVLSPDGRYRYRLEREWDFFKPRVVFVMLNPSTADAEKDDPTIRRCIGFAKSWGYGGLVVVNLYAFRATKPADLWKLPSGGCVRDGPENMDWLRRTCTAGRPVVLAWGAGGSRGNIGANVTWIMRHKWRIVPLALALTHKDQQPAHPLYLRADLQPRSYAALYAEYVTQTEAVK